MSLNKKIRPLVPEQHRRAIMGVFHQVQHPGVKESVRKIGERYYWPLMKQQITDYVHSCKGCLGAKAKKTITPEVKPMPVLMPRFHDIALDIVGPLPWSNGARYLLTIVDRTSRYLQAVPMASATAKACCDAFLTGGSPTSASPRSPALTTASVFSPGYGQTSMSPWGPSSPQARSTRLCRSALWSDSIKT